MNKHPVPPSHFPSPLLAGVLLLAAGCLAYSNSFGVPFIFDDEPSLLRNETIRHLWSAWFPPNGEGLTVSGRPVLNFSFALNFAVSETGVWSYHVVNLLIHCAAGLVLCDLVRRTLGLPRVVALHGAGRETVAFAAAALWLLHPLQTESVTYVVQRAESLVAFFYLSTLWCFVRTVEPGAPTLWRIGAVAACLLGMATKEVMATAPLLVALYDRMFVGDSWRQVIRERGKLHGAFAATWLLLLGLVLSNAGRGGTAGFNTPVSPVDYALTQFGALAHYLRLVVWPAPLVLDYGRELVTHWPAVVWPALFIATLAGASLRACRRGHAAGYCGVFFFAVLAPSSSIVPIATQTMAEHRMYLPLAAIAVLAAATGRRLFPRGGITLLLAVAVLFGCVTWRRNTDYASRVTLYEGIIRERPKNARAMALLGDYYLRDGRAEDAGRMLERSLALEPGVPEVLNNLGLVQLELGRSALAVENFRQARALRPADPAFAGNLGHALLEAGHPDAGLAELEAAVQLAPGQRSHEFNLASALAQTGRLEAAANRFAALAAAQPQDAEIQARYGRVLLGLERKADALAHLETAVKLDPGNADRHDEFGLALARSGRMREALAQFEAALALDPGHAGAAQNAARARQLLGQR